jgi:predicted nuclease of predicted toxin-antitoxin system
VSDVFIKVYLDEDVNVLIAEIVRSRNFEALTVTEAGRKGKSDAEQLKFAAEADYAILTHNRVDYENLAKDYFANDKRHYGIIIAVRRPSSEIAERLLSVLNDFTADEMKNQIIYI